MIYEILFVYFVLVSLVAVVITAWDKHCAKRDMWRIPESTLLIISALGGSLAMFITMRTIRHKTKHPKFMFGIPAIMVAQVAAIIAVVWLLYR